jgi:hypothetical protein
VDCLVLKTMELPKASFPPRCWQQIPSGRVEAELPGLEALNEPDDAAGEVEETI